METRDFLSPIDVCNCMFWGINRAALTLRGDRMLNGVSLHPLLAQAAGCCVERSSSTGDPLRGFALSLMEDSGFTSLNQSCVSFWNSSFQWVSGDTIPDFQYHHDALICEPKLILIVRITRLCFSWLGSTSSPTPGHLFLYTRLYTSLLLSCDVGWRLTLSRCWCVSFDVFWCWLRICCSWPFYTSSAV